jgi:hypothetical protein
MNGTMTITCPVQFQREHRGRRRLENGHAPTPVPLPAGRVPRVARLMALALHLDDQVRRGLIQNYAALADLGHVSRARISQIMNLVNLAPDIQEAILSLPRTEHGRDAIYLAQLQPIALTIDWRKQRCLWRELAMAHRLLSGA